MMPDKTKKYKLLGLTFSHGNDIFPWKGIDNDGQQRMGLNSEELAYQIEQGNAVEIRDPREFTAKGWRSIDAENHIVLNSGLPEWADEFEVTIREVLK